MTLIHTIVRLTSKPRYCPHCVVAVLKGCEQRFSLSCITQDAMYHLLDVF
jgi:hypothetical protein